MKMTETSKIGFQVTGFLLLAAGAIMFLCQVHLSGTAIEACSLSLSLNTISIFGGGLAVLSVAALLVLHFGNNNDRGKIGYVKRLGSILRLDKNHKFFYDIQSKAVDDVNI